MFNNKSILITGGTGSFGQKFTEEILRRYKVKKIVIYSRDEFKQDQMQKKFLNSNIRFFIGDVRDNERLNFAMRNIDFVIHAAALKQVVAAEYNPGETVKTNVIGAENVIKAAINNEVLKVIALSTDKAVNPVNLYGATKLASDKLFIAANNIVGRNKTRFSVVRYGNVIGSRGSVLPLFIKLHKEGSQTLPITSEDMTRFWISLQQGVDFSIKCFQMMIGGEILISKSSSIKIVDLAKAVNSKAKIKLIGIRPGEKIHESLCSQDDSKYTLEFNNHYLIKPSISLNIKSSYIKNKLNEMGKKVKSNFQYNSGTNNDFLTRNQIKTVLKSLSY
ncbi:UDP-N-acetylglucosamine 4,6-dehydratase (inverting) [Candidatus Pelagibacter sp.]|jgi:UDP-N-acetylglucosamine 4,6-dehydratase|nr:UDP-N-acetylglucosamine 4,6-dehydratase (inverting) [Candidatus Pelagibacter sp.]